MCHVSMTITRLEVKVCQEFNFQSHSQPQKQYLDIHNSTIFSSILFKLGQ